MAQLLAAAPPEPGRISQILPTVKCSNCNQPVPIAELGDHICAPPPPAVATTLKPPPSPTTTASLLPQKFQNLVSLPRSQTPPARDSQSTPTRQPSPLNPQRVNSPGPALQPRARAPSTASSLSTRSGDSRPERVASPLARIGTPDSARLPFPTSSSHAEAPRTSSLSIARNSSRPIDVPSHITREAETFRVPTPGRDTPSTLNAPASRARAPSTASVQSHTSAFPVRQPAQSNPTLLVQPLHVGPNAQNLSVQPRPRAATNASMPAPPASPDIIYSTTDYRGGPMNFQPTQPTQPTQPMQPMRARAPSVASRRPSLAPSMMSVMTSASPHTAPPAPGAAREIDTESGGEAGMAGVGRRGFAAAARAAVAASTMGHAAGIIDHPWSSMAPMQGMDGRRTNAPRFLDIASATNYGACYLYRLFFIFRK